MQFEGQFPGPSNQNWDMVQATVTANVYSNLAFSKLFSLSAPNLQAVSTAAHRARDICLILDYSGSMRFSSLLGLPIGYDNGGSNSTGRSSNNLDTVYPAFGHYSAAASLIKGSAPSSPYDDANISATTSDERPPIVQDFYQDANGTPAFTSCALELQHHSRGRHSREDQLQQGRVVCANGVPDAEPRLDRHVRRQFREGRLCPPRLQSDHLGDVQRLYGGAGLLGQDVLHLAARSQERLADDVFQFPHGPGGQFPALEHQQRELAGPRRQRQQRLHHRLRRDLDLHPHGRSAGISAGVAIGPHRLLHADSPDHRHVGLAADRPQSAILESLYRLRARSHADQFQYLRCHQSAPARGTRVTATTSYGGSSRLRR